MWFGWAALAAALPAMRSLTALLASGCEGLGATEGGEAAGVAALAATEGCSRGWR